MSAYTLLEAACQGNIHEVLRLLDVNNIDVNSTGRGYWEGRSALGVAARWGYSDIVSLLLDRGADANAPDDVYGSALGAATWIGHEGIVSMLLDRGADVNSSDGDNRPALSEAARRGHMEIVSILLDQGADVNR